MKILKYFINALISIGMIAAFNIAMIIISSVIMIPFAFMPFDITELGIVGTTVKCFVAFVIYALIIWGLFFISKKIFSGKYNAVFSFISNFAVPAIAVLLFFQLCVVLYNNEAANYVFTYWVDGIVHLFIGAGELKAFATIFSVIIPLFIMYLGLMFNEKSKQQSDNGLEKNEDSERFYD